MATAGGNETTKQTTECQLQNCIRVPDISPKIKFLVGRLGRGNRWLPTPDYTRSEELAGVIRAVVKCKNPYTSRGFEFSVAL